MHRESKACAKDLGAIYTRVSDPHDRAALGVERAQAYKAKKGWDHLDSFHQEKKVDNVVHQAEHVAHKLHVDAGGLQRFVSDCLRAPTPSVFPPRISTLGGAEGPPFGVVVDNPPAGREARMLDSWRQARACAEAGNILEAELCYIAALDLMNADPALRQRTYDLVVTEYLTALSKAADAYIAAQRYQDAELLLSTILRNQDGITGVRTVAMPKHLLKRSSVYVREQRYAEARADIQRALELLRAPKKKDDGYIKAIERELASLP